MAQKFTVPITVKQLTSASSDAVTVFVDADTFARLKVEAGGRLVWGSGASAGDVNLYRDGADVLRTDDTFKTPTLFVDSIEIDPTGATTDQILKFDGTKFAPATGTGATTNLDGLTDVVITTPAEFQSLTYDGTNWVNSYASTVTYVRNAEATTLTTGTVVYLFGATGDHATVKRADKGSDTTSSKTVGLVGANITASNNGPVITRGYVDGIDLSVGYSAGDILWLGSNGAFTTTKATAPDHLVFVGVVVRATNNGIIYVATQNGYELDELHNVQIDGSLASGDFLKYNGTLWVNDPINLGTDTVGNYMSDISAGTGISVTHTPSEGSTGTVAIDTAVVPQLAVTNTFTTNQIISGSTTADLLRITQTGTGNALTVEDSANPDSTPTVIDAAGRIVSGTNLAISTYQGAIPQIQAAGSGASASSFLGSRFSADSNGPGLYLNKSRSATIPTQTAVVSGDRLGNIYFNGTDGTSWLLGAAVTGEAEGTISTGVVPGRLLFFTASSAGTITERMRINSAGEIGIGGTPTASITLRVSKQITGAINAYGIVSQGVIQSDVTSSGYAFYSGVGTAASATVSNVIHYLAVQGTFDATSTVTTQSGFQVSSGMTGATNNYSFSGNLAAATGRWNLYMGGTADNYLAGRLGVGATLTSGAMAQITNTTAADIAFIVKGAASQTGDLFEVQNSAGTAQFEISSAGAVSIGSTQAATSLNLTKNISGSVNSQALRIASPVASGVTGEARYISIVPSVDASVAMTNLVGTRIYGAALGAGASITSQVGFWVDSTFTTGTNNYGFIGDISAGTGRWNLYMGATAANYLAGRLGVGATNTSGAMTVITNTTAADKVLVVKGAASQTGIPFEIQNSAGAATFYVGTTGNVIVANGTNSVARLEIGEGRTADADSWLDLVGDTTYTDYGLRILRSSGANGNTALYHRGTGLLNIKAQEAAAITFDTSNTERMRIDSSGQVGIGSTTAAGYGILAGKNITGAVSSYGMVIQGQIQSDVTSNAVSFVSVPSTAAASFTLATLTHFSATGIATPGAGSAITNQVGFRATSTLTGATNNWGFQGAIAAGTGRFNLYMNGTADNYLAGRLGVGATLTSGAMAQITNTTAADIALVVKGAASQTGTLFDIQNSAGTSLVNVDATGTILNVGSNTVTSSTVIQVGNGRTGNGYSYIDLVGDATYTDYGFRMLRGNTGANTTSTLISRGTGALEIWTQEAAPITFNTTATERMRIDSAGNVGIGVTPVAGRTFTLTKNMTGATTVFGILNNGVIQSDVTAEASYYRSGSNTAAASFIVPALYHYYAVQGSIGAGSTVTTQAAFVVGAGFTGASNNIGFYGDIASASGRWNLYMSGTADNYLSGNTGIGGLPVANIKLHVAGPAANSANPTIRLTGVSGSGTLNFFNDLSAGSYNNIVAAGSKGIIAAGANSSTTRASFVIAPWSDVSYGIRFEGGATTNILQHGTTIFQPSATTGVAAVVRGLASQTANLFEVQNSAGTVLGYVAADGSSSFYEGDQNILAASIFS